MSESLLITLGVEDKGASKQLSALNKEIRYLDKEFKTTTKTSKDYEKGTETLEKKLTLLQNKYEANKSKLQVYNKQMQETQKSIEKKKAELEKLVNSEGDNEQAIQKVNNQLGNYEAKLRDTQRNINLTEAELKNLNGEMAETENSIKTKPLMDYSHRLQEVGTNLENTGEKLKKFGSGLSSMGGSLMKWSAPLVAVGGAVGTMSMEFEDNIQNINTLLDDTTNLEKYESTIKQLSRQTGKDLGTMSDGMYQAISSIGDLGDETVGIFNVMTKSAKGGKAEVADTVALISSAMKGYGQVNTETAQKISDLGFQTAKLGVTTFPELAKSMQPLFPLANGIGLSLEELFGVMATGTGVTGNTSEVVTQFKAVLQGLTKPTSDMAKVMEKYGFSSGQAMLESKGFTGVLEILKKETGGASDKMAKLFGSTEALTLVSALCGSQFDTFKDKLNAMNNSAGATDTAFEKVSSTTKDKMTVSFNNMKVSLTEAGKSMLPVFEVLAEQVGKLADWIGSLDSETIKNIATMGAWGLGIGSVLKVAGGLASSIGSITSITGRMTKAVGQATEGKGALGKVFNLVTGKGKDNVKTMKNVTESVGGVTKASGLASGLKGVGGVLKVFTSLNPISIGVGASLGVVAGGMAIAKTNSDLLAKSTTTASEELGWFEKIVSKFNGTQFQTQQQLEANNIVFAEFSEGISEEFGQAVEVAHQKSNEFRFELSKMNADGVISETEHSNFATAVSELCNTAIQTVQSKSTENQEALKNMFNADGVLSEEEIKTMEALQRITEGSITEINDRKAKILEIENIALGEKRGLNETEIAEIQAHQQRIREIELQALGGTQEEILFAKNEFGNRIATMNQEQATTLLTQKKAELDENLIQISSSYDTQIQMLEGSLASMNETERANAVASIEQLKSDKQLKIAEQTGLWDEYIGIISEKNPKLLETLNIFNGQELTQADAKKQRILNTLQEEYSGLDSITQSGNYRMVNQTTGAYHDIAVAVDEATGKIIGVYDKTTNRVGAYTDDMAKDVKALSREHGSASEQISQALEKSANATVDGSGNIRTANGEVIGSLQSVQDQADGTHTAMLQLGDERIEIKTNADGTIQDLENLRRKIASIPSSKDVSINYRYRTYGSPPSEANSSGRSIDIPMSRSALASEGSLIPNIPATRELPATYDNMITTPTFYSSDSPIIQEARGKYEGERKKAPNGDKNNDSQIDYKLLGEIVALAVAKAVANLKIEPVINNLLDSDPITSKVSQGLAHRTRGKR